LMLSIRLSAAANGTGQKSDSTGFPVARTQDRSQGCL